MTPEVDEEKLKSLFGEHALRLPLNANSAPKGDLAVQDLSTMDVAKLTPLTPEIISRQATINIGTIGHVAHGKSTVVKAISGVQTVRFKNELVRNITIKLGYANAKIYRSSEKYVCHPPHPLFPPLPACSFLFTHTRTRAQPTGHTSTAPPTVLLLTSSRSLTTKLDAPGNLFGMLCCSVALSVCLPPSDLVFLHQPCVVCRLPWSRHSDGHHA